MSRSGRSADPVETLIYSVLPELSKLPERARRERVAELVEYCDDILNSRIPSSLPLGANGLADAARRQLTSADDALRFNSLWSSIQRGRVLSSPNKHLQFLTALAGMSSDEPKRFSATKISSPPPKSRPSSVTVLNEVDLASPPRTPVPSAAGKSRAALLQEWRTQHHRPPFPEHLLLRDALYLLQGIDGRYVQFALSAEPQRNPYLTDKGRAGDGTGFPLGKDGQDPEAGEQEVVGIKIVEDEGKGVISQPTKSVLVQLSEMGVLYRKITNFIKLHQAAGPSAKSGMIIQSLCHFLHHELSEYHRLLAVLESQMSMTAPDSTSPAEGSGLTLLRLGLWTEDMKLKLQLMEMVVDDAESAHGGALVSKIHSRTAHGDPVVRQFTDQILEEVSKPFFLTLQKWITSGELHDPFKEFFVQLNPDMANGDDAVNYTGDAGFEEGFDIGGGVSDSSRIWEKKYVFVKAMVPGFINQDFGKKIFSTGRSLNFIRYNCYDSDWVTEKATLANRHGTLKYSDLTGLERSIDDAYSTASQRLLDIFFDKYKLLDHLRALKSYLMLGAGDFAELLLEALAPRLDKPAISLYRHHLTSDLESAIRGSNAQYDSPDVLRRLDARVLEYQHGELGWDCFALEYRVESPLNAILDARAMDGYDRLFHHLWRLKRVESTLTAGWMRVTSESRNFDKLPNLANLWHHCRVVQAEMVHFLRQLQAFIQLEVVECSWRDLMEYTDKREGDLDALIVAHKTYLDRVVRKMLLLSPRKDDKDFLLNLVREALDLILAFCAATDDLFSWSLAVAVSLDAKRDRERGIRKTLSNAETAPPDFDKLEDIRERIRNCAAQFGDTVSILCKEAGAHPDLDVRFLAIRIAFNGYYGLKRGSKKKQGSSV